MSIPYSASTGKSPAPKGPYRRPTPDELQVSRKNLFLYLDEKAAHNATKAALQALEAEIQTLRSTPETLALQEELRLANERISVLEAEKSAVENTLRQREGELRAVLHSSLTVGEQASWLIFRQHWTRDDLPTDGQGRKYINLKTLALDYGRSDDALGRDLKKFVRLGLVDKHLEKAWDESSGKADWKIWAAPIEQAARRIRWIDKETAGNTWGGKHCKKCGSPYLKITRECLNCGEINITFTGPKEPEEAPSPDEQTVPQVAVPWIQRLSPPRVVDALPPAVPQVAVVEYEEEDRAASCGTVDLAADDCPTLPHLPIVAPHVEPVHPSEAEEKQESPPGPGDAVDPEPQVAARSLRRIPASWSDERLERETVARLHWTSKDCPAVVVMTGKENPKYIQEKPDTPPTLEEIQAHLAGRRTLAYKAHDAPYSCLFKMETDMPAGVQAFEAALPILVNAGLLPIIEYSPVHGAGLVKKNGEPRDSAHLIFHFWQAVPVRAFWALLARLAPDLLVHIDKKWPGDGSNMRMPLPYYRQPEIEGWCTVLSGVTEERARADTPAAWRLFLSHQADPRVVPELPPEPPAPEPECPPRFTLPALPVYSGPGPQFSPKDVYAWFNEHHTLDGIHPRTTKTHALAVWRDDTVPSVRYYDNGRWWDYGSNEGGDKFDLYWHVRRITKSQALSEQAKLYREFLLGQRQEARPA